MGNTNNSASGSASSAQDSTAKDVHIRTDKPDGFYFTGELLTGTVEIPTAFVYQQAPTKNSRKGPESLRRRSFVDPIAIELVGDAAYSAEVDAAADSDGHATHAVNICRLHCFVTLNQDNGRQADQNKNQAETSFSLTTNTPTRASSDNQAATLSTLPTMTTGIFQLQIPGDLPPSLVNNRPPSVIYSLELSLSSSRYRYQIPIIISSRGCLPQPNNDIELVNSAMNQHDIGLQASLARRFYRPGEQICVRVTCTNPQQRAIRSIAVTLLQLYRVHNDQHNLQLDGKEWTFDVSNMISQREWIGEAYLQLPAQPLQASFSNCSVGTTQLIQCELDYRIFVQLNEKKGDDIHLTLPSILVTYQA